MLIVGMFVVVAAVARFVMGVSVAVVVPVIMSTATMRAVIIPLVFLVVMIVAAAAGRLGGVIVAAAAIFVMLMVVQGKSAFHSILRKTKSCTFESCYFPRE